MRRKGVVVATGRTHLRIDLGSGQYVRLKKSAYPSLTVEMRARVALTVSKHPMQPRRSADDEEVRRQSRWIAGCIR